MSLLSTILDAALPNRAWNRAGRAPRDPRGRLVRWGIRIALIVLIVTLLVLLGVQQFRIQINNFT